MEIFDKLKSLVGIGTATIEVSEATTPVRAGAELRATVTLRGRVLAKGETLTLPVALPLPAELEPSGEHRRYLLIAETEVPGLNPKHSIVVEVVA